MQPIILAAGKGTRMGSNGPKTLVPIGGRPMLGWILDTFARIPGLETPIINVGYKADDVKKFGGPRYIYPVQKDLSGTGTAVLNCMPYVSRDAQSVYIQYGDHPFITIESIKKLRDTLEEEEATLVLGVAHIPNFDDWRSVFIHFGRVERDEEGNVKDIVEYKNATEEQRALQDVNPGFYCADAAWLREALPRIKPNPVNGEYYLTDIVEIAKADGKKVLAVDITPEEAIGINSPAEAALAESLKGLAKKPVAGDLSLQVQTKNV